MEHDFSVGDEIFVSFEEDGQLRNGYFYFRNFDDFFLTVHSKRFGSTILIPIPKIQKIKKKNEVRNDNPN